MTSDEYIVELYKDLKREKERAEDTIKQLRVLIGCLESRCDDLVKIINIFLKFSQQDFDLISCYVHKGSGLEELKILLDKTGFSEAEEE